MFHVLAAYQPEDGDDDDDDDDDDAVEARVAFDKQWSVKLADILRTHQVPHDATDGFGRLPLHSAAANGHSSLVQFFISQARRLPDVSRDPVVDLINAGGHWSRHAASFSGT